MLDPNDITREMIPPEPADTTTDMFDEQPNGGVKLSYIENGTPPSTEPFKFPTERNRSEQEPEPKPIIKRKKPTASPKSKPITSGKAKIEEI